MTRRFLLSTLLECPLHQLHVKLSRDKTQDRGPPLKVSQNHLVRIRWIRSANGDLTKGKGSKKSKGVTRFSARTGSPVKLECLRWRRGGCAGSGECYRLLSALWCEPSAPCEKGVITIVLKRRPWHREVKLHAGGDTAFKRQSWDLNLGLCALEPGMCKNPPQEPSTQPVPPPGKTWMA